MNDAQRHDPMARRFIAYAVTFAAFYFLGTMDGMRVWIQFGLFFVGLIASTILSFIIFLFIATLIPPKGGLWVSVLVAATEIAASTVVLKLLIAIVPAL
jgi:hypothetical protein